MFGHSTHVSRHVAVGPIASALSALAVGLSLLFPASPAPAATVTSGDVQPADATTWNNDTTAYIGQTTAGTLAITDGSGVTVAYGYIGHGSGATGTVTVNGPGSTWTGALSLYVGGAGSGSLAIAHGGLVRMAGGTYVDPQNAGRGTIHFDGGTLDTGSLFADEADLTGTGTIILHHLIADRDLVFDSVDDVTEPFHVYNSQPGQNIAIHLTIDGQGTLGAGNRGAGSLTIGGGMEIGSMYGYLGYEPGSSGVATIAGKWSAWTTYTLYVGDFGAGTLDVANQGYLGTEYGFVGFGSGATGTVSVDGVDSAWVNHRDLYVGYAGAGVLSIANGGLVRVDGSLMIDEDLDGNAFVNMSSGGSLALWGQVDESLDDFLSRVDGTDAIRFWNEEIAEWANIATGTPGEDYTLRYFVEGDMAGYTVLSVRMNPASGGKVPEPAGWALLAGLAVLPLARRVRRWGRRPTGPV